MEIIYVIAWHYYDHSGSGVLHYAYKNKEEAERALKLLQEHGMRAYELKEMELLGD